MNAKITHQYIVSQEDEVFVELLVGSCVVLDMCAVVQFIAEDYIDDCCTVSPELMGIILEEFNLLTVLERDSKFSVEVDLYSARDSRCGEWYRKELEKYSDYFSKIKYLLDENRNLIW